MAAISLKEKGKRCNLITSGLTPFSFIVLAILRNLPTCSLGSSVGWPINSLCYTMVISAGFSSKLLASIAGCLTAEYSSWITGLQKSSIVSCIGGLSVVVSYSTVLPIISSAIIVVSVLLTFLKFLNVLSNSISKGNISDSGFLCMKELPKMETY